MSAVRQVTITQIAVFLIVLVASTQCKKREDPVVKEEGPAQADSLLISGAWVFGEPQPGISGLPSALIASLESAWKTRPSDYKPRTRHLQSDGSPKYSNRLLLESSPYLLQHAHNPVNWYPWGDEAFATAKRLGLPVLLSIGYSTCHWCHVMEEESFEDEEVARYLNEHYIAIKVDREERPDIDAIYMSAVRELTGRGGWPMTSWLTSDRKPFFAGTYFPRARFLTALKKSYREYLDDPKGVAATASDVTAKIQRHLQPASRLASDLPDVSMVKKAAEIYQGRLDEIHGGTVGRPKFPSSMPTRFMLRHYRRTGDKKSLHAAVFSLEKMAGGGMYDHVGGGFHRYSTDSRWLVPHFEKMLYDNALLVMSYLEAYQVTGREDFARVVRETLRWVERDMTSPEGGFYSATDADSLTPKGHREEGWFFTWTPSEIDAVVGKERARVVKAYYGVTERGNFEGRNIFNTPRPLAVVAKELELEPSKVLEIVGESKELLYTARNKRPMPLRDDKILAAWNGLTISAYAQAALVLDEPAYAKIAGKAARFLIENMKDSRGRLLRSYKNGSARHDGYLDDHAFFIAGLLDLYEVTHELPWLSEAVALDKVLADHFSDEQGGGYFVTSDDHEELLAREKPRYDGAVPSGNSIHATNLLRLHEYTSSQHYLQRAELMFAEFDALLRRAPSAMSEMLLALDLYLDQPKQIVIVTTKSRDEAAPFLEKLRQTYLPNRILVVASEGADLEAQAKLVPMAESKIAQSGRVTAYVCEQRVCELPTGDPEVFAKQIRKVRPLARYRQ